MGIDGFDMADTMSPAVRSRIMSRVRSRDTRPERYVRQAIWRSGFRYRLHVKRLPGIPDLALKRYMAVIFVHGCFWHQHGCPKSKRPSSNRDYWDEKLSRNAARDKENKDKLQQAGWTVLTVWECKLQEGTEDAIRFLKGLRSALIVR